MDLPARISTLQRADRWIGVPLCAILTLVRKVLGSTKPLDLLGPLLLLSQISRTETKRRPLIVP